MGGCLVVLSDFIEEDPDSVGFVDQYYIINEKAYTLLLPFVPQVTFGGGPSCNYTYDFGIEAAWWDRHWLWM